MLIAMLSGFLLLVASTARAQQEQSAGYHEVTVQGTGFFTKNSEGNGINQRNTDAGGVLINYLYHFNRWLAAETSYGDNQSTQQNLTSSEPLDVESNVHQATAAMVLSLLWAVARLHLS